MNSVHTTLLYHFCRLRLSQVNLPVAAFERHSLRAYEMFRAKRAREGQKATWDAYIENLHALDWFIACASLDGLEEGWRALFHSRANRTDALLVDALRMRAVRLFPRDPERQDEAVNEFWGFLLAGHRDGSPAILARYDGQRPLVPWLIRVFQNKHLSDLRHSPNRPLPEDDLDDRALPFPSDGDDRWHEEFRQAAREWLNDLPDNEVLILGLRLRYRLSQREAAGVLGINEGNVSRQTARLRDRCLERIGRRLQEVGWTGDDLSGYILKEMDTLLLDEPRLSADRLAALLAAREKKKKAAGGERPA